ncbi:MAG: stage III sporulation protein AB [Oscillospiraceae bacterium]|nr:stage III sporulation protein AB [Oscillospiraceae bacterium]
MITKAVGLCLVFITPVIAGYYASNQVRAECAQLYGLIKLIKHAKRKISGFMTRQEEIFDDFDDVALERCGFLDCLRNQKLISEDSLLRTAVVSFENRLSVSPAAKSALFEFSESFGKLSAEEQSESCDSCAAALNELYDESRSRADIRAKLCRTIGFSAGAVAAIMLI